MTQLWIIIIVTFLAFLQAVDTYGLYIGFGAPVIMGLIIGLLMGDVKTGLYVGGTLQLMSLGVVGLGGASVPNYCISTIITTYIAIATKKGMAAGLAIGLPVGMLAIQCDVISKILCNFIAHKAQDYANKKQFKKMYNVLRIGPFIFGLSAAIPVFISVAAGPTVINYILKYTPYWFSKGLTVAGGLLPLVGICILLRYMPTKKYLSYILIGFVLAAYLKVPILGIAIIGIALAYELYKRNVQAANSESVGGNFDE